MCTLAIYFQATDSRPVVIAANRDEFFARPASGPVVLGADPEIVGGRDLREGGTWLGINQYGLVAGLLNRYSQSGAVPGKRSRGLLCLDALRFRTPAAAAEFVAAERVSDYNPFNLLIGSREAACVAYSRAGHIEVAALSPGLHLLTNLDVDDFECPRISASYAEFAAIGADPEFRLDPVRRRDELARVLASHRLELDPRSGRPNSLCLHLDSYGTRSSSLIFLGNEPHEIEHFFAPGPPCTTGYASAPVPGQPPPR